MTAQNRRAWLGVTLGAIAFAGACAVSFPEADLAISNTTSTGGASTTGTAGTAGATSSNSISASASSSSSGGCVPECAGGLTCCEGTCSLTLTDTNNCGKCGVVCATDALCDNSKCVCGAGGPLCSAGSTCCGTTCKDLATDIANCGMCGNVCAANETCGGSLCLCGGKACAAGNTCCDGTTCSNLALDPANCGACGTACPLGDTCSMTGCSDWADWPMPNPVSTGLPHPQSYTSMAGYVLDNVTGLSWQQPIDVDNDQSMNCLAGCTQAQAIAYCANLTLGGHGDWRLPTRIELVSIVDTTVVNPSINAAAFPGTSSQGFWTSSPNAQSAASAWTVFFSDGGSCADCNVTTKPNRVRCVR